VVEEETGEHYMVYGSFWDGIRLLRLDRKTGFAAEEGYGLSIAKRSQTAVGTVEEAYIRYNGETGYYYLFVSYDSLSDFYNVRVGKSRTIFGPYLDFNGNAMTNTLLPPNHVGLKITTGYSFKPDTGFIALGHNSVLNRNNEWFLVCHARYENDNRRHCLNVRKMLFTKDGWPVVSPALYSGERVEQICQAEAVGKYLRIDFVQDAKNLAERPTYMELFGDNTAKIGDSGGKWSFNAEESRLMISYRGTEEEYYIMPAKDHEESGNTYVLTGINRSGNCIWCKKV
jgi:arabinan endo-1,5-alpha-L-arabinosidase